MTSGLVCYLVARYLNRILIISRIYRTPTLVGLLNRHYARSRCSSSRELPRDSFNREQFAPVRGKRGKSTEG